MSSNPRFALHKSAGLTLVALALMSGCATQEAVTEQTDPLRRQLEQMQASLQSTTATAQAANDLATAGRARDEALSKQLETLLAEFKALQEGQATLKDGLSKADLRLDELASLARDNAEALAASQEQLAAVADLSERLTKADLRLDELATQAAGQAEAAAQTADLAERLTKADLRLDELATTGKQVADASAATQAKLAATAEGTAVLGGRLAETEKRVDTLAAQVQEALAASKQEYIRQYGKVVSTIRLTEDKTLFPINSPELGAGDRAKLDALAARLKSSQEEYHLDIQGHTDNIGTDDTNYALGKARAEVVKRYLHERGGLPLSRMSVISYGATQPATAGGSGNRRIVINLLVLDKK